MGLIAVRHAPGTSDDVCRGASEKPVDRSPEAAAEAILGALSALTEGPRARSAPSVVWTSDLPRCHLPARRVAATLGAPCRPDVRLRELSFGAWEGRPWEMLRGEPAFERWCTHWETEGPPGGESARALGARVADWLDETSVAGLVVTHAGVIRALWNLEGQSWPAVMSRPVPHLTPIVFDRS